MSNTGVIRALFEFVIRVQFDDGMPAIHEIIEVDNVQKTPLLVLSLETADTVLCATITTDHTLHKNMTVHRTGQRLQLPVGTALLGRAFDGLGRPIDGKSPLDDSQLEKRDIFISSARSTSSRFMSATPKLIETGIKAIDFFAPLVQGSKLGIIGGVGTGKTVLAMELINNLAYESSAVVVFAGIGQRLREGHELYDAFDKAGLLQSVAMFFGHMHANPVQRSLSMLAATTVAEYFRDDQQKDVLFFADTLSQYLASECLTTDDRGASDANATRGDRRYQLTMFSDMNALQGRLSSNEHGTITAIQTVSAPADVASDPAVRMIARTFDSTIVLSRVSAARGTWPAVDLHQTTSSLVQPDNVGERHYMLHRRVRTLLQRYETLQAVVAARGESVLREQDRADCAKAQRLLQYFVQPFSVMEHATGEPGERFTREETLSGIEHILA